uniref:Putative ABC-type peptide transport system, permease component 2 (ABC.PE.P1) n=1 Tax=uncultured marine group II/III euryarchaeote AD1000_72_D09 TaxID=1457805 RepID=A0A075G2U3_9EURY|nr:putative ABC-type peptide transport system, permease component 2 (ABC.PE.P1) [uncultured marine group II/III euryarchaeote AD1000_72_D09]
MRDWEEGEEERKESLRRLLEALSQFRNDISRSWKIYRRSLLAVLGLLLVTSVVTVSIFADDIAVEHPYRNLQDTEDLWSIDYEPRRAHPFSEECDWHEQSISLTKQRRDEVMTVVAESDDKVGDDNRYYRDTLTVIELVHLEDNLGYDLDASLISIDPNNSSILVLSQELYDNMSLTTIWLTYEFDNEAMHIWWMPEGYERCIFGTNDQGQDMFSKVLYGSRVSLKIGITVAMLTVTIGTIVGSISGYFGGRVDEVIMRICDVFFAIPGLILAMAFVTAMSAMTSLTMPVWLGVLIPILFLFVAFRSYLASTVAGDQLSDQVMGSLMRNRKLFLGLFVFFFFVGLFPGASWSDLFGISDSRSWRFASAIGVILLLGVIALADMRFIEKTSFDGVGERVSKSLDWTNPWRYLTLRTVAVFVAIVVLYRFSGGTGDEIVVIRDFDRLWKIQAALIFTGWPGYARLIRGQVLYVKEMTFVEAARSVGAPSGRIMFRHILPNAWAPLLVAFTLDIGGTILSASGLSFIGLGAAPGTAEWGILVSESRRYFVPDPHLMLYPGLAIAVTTLGFNLLGDGIRDVVDPKNRR